MEYYSSVKNILLLDHEGKNVAAKYFTDDWPTHASKRAFEKTVFSMIHRPYSVGEVDINMIDDCIVVHKHVSDVYFFVTGGEFENELTLATVLEGFFEAVYLLLRKGVDKWEALAHLNLILLCIDEIVDGGFILETDGKVIARNVLNTSGFNEAESSPKKQTILDEAMSLARQHLLLDLF